MFLFHVAAVLSVFCDVFREFFVCDVKKKTRYYPMNLESGPFCDDVTVVCRRPIQMDGNDRSSVSTVNREDIHVRDYAAQVHFVGMNNRME